MSSGNYPIFILNCVQQWPSSTFNGFLLPLGARTKLFSPEHSLPPKIVALSWYYHDVPSVPLVGFPRDVKVLVKFGPAGFIGNG